MGAPHNKIARQIDRSPKATWAIVDQVMNRYDAMRHRFHDGKIPLMVPDLYTKGRRRVRFLPVLKD